MLCWITDFLDEVKKNPKKYNENIKNQCRLIKELLSRPNIEYKESDPIAFVDFCGLFTHQKGEWAGQPFVPDETQKFLIACVMGIKYYDKKYNQWLRYFRHCNLFVARKYGKSFLAAAFVLWFLGLDKENGAEVKIIAENKDQSSRLFRTVDASRRTSSILSKWFKKRHNKDTNADEIYTYDKNGNECIFTYESGRSTGHDGDSNNLIICDEAHEITKFEQYESKVTGQGARKQPLALVISTAGVTPESLYESLYDRNVKMLEKKKYGAGDDVFALMFGIDPTDDPEDTSVWCKANPGTIYHDRPTMQYLKSQFAKAKGDPIAWCSFLAKHLNRQIGASIGYYDMLSIKRAGAKIELKDFADTYAVGGVDLAETTDLCNATAMILRADGKFLILQAYFIAEECLARNSKKDNMDYERWTNAHTDNEVTSRVVIITPGSYVRKEYVTQWFCLLRDEYKINFLKIGYDRALSKEWLTDMQENGFSHEVAKVDREQQTEDRDYGILTSVAQGGWSLSEPIKIIKQLFDDGKIIYDERNHLLGYCFYNLRVRVDANNNLSPHKAKSTGHIDGAIGIFNGFVAYLRVKQLEEYKNNLPELLTI